MPQVLAMLPMIMAVAGTGASIIQGFTHGGGSAPPDNSAALAAQNAESERKAQAQLEQQKSMMLRRAAPDAQAATGGSLAPDSFANLTAILAGIPGDVQLAQRLLGGNTDIGGFGGGFGSTGNFGSGNSGLTSQFGQETSSGMGFGSDGQSSMPSMPGMNSGGMGSGSGGSVSGGDFSGDSMGGNMQDILSSLLQGG